MRVHTFFGQGKASSASPVFDESQLVTVPVDDATPAQELAAAQESAVGLRTLYSRMFSGGLVSVPTSTTGRTRCGTAFAVKADTISVPVLDGSMKDVNVWRMSLASLLVPFSVPIDFRAKRVKLDWSPISSSSTAGGKILVWLARSYVATMPGLTDPAFHTGVKSQIGEWELLGAIDATDAGTGSPAKCTETFDFDPLEGYGASLLFTAYISLDAEDFDNPSLANFSKGVCTGFDVDEIAGTATGGTWKPDITLLG